MFNVNSNYFGSMALRQLNHSNDLLGQSILRLSSGTKQNKMSDDPLAASISDRLKYSIASLKAARQNSQNTNSLMQTAESSTQEVVQILQRMRELAVSSANGVYTESDRKGLEDEYESLRAEIDRISETTTYNTKKLLNGAMLADSNTDSDKLKMHFTKPVDNGQYSVQYDVKPGSNAIYNSNIMRINEGSYGVKVVDSSNSTNVYGITAPYNFKDASPEKYNVTVGGDYVGDHADFSQRYLTKGASWSLHTQSSAGSTVHAVASGYAEITWLTSATSTSVKTTGLTYKARFYDSKTGQFSNEVTGKITSSTGATINVGLASFKVNFDNMQRVLPGDKALVNISHGTTTAAGLSSSGAGTVKVYDASTKSYGPTVVFTGVRSLTKPNNHDNKIDVNGVKLFSATLDTASGTLVTKNFTMQFAENSDSKDNPVTQTGVVTMQIHEGGQVATRSTLIKDIDIFRSRFTENQLRAGQQLTLLGHGSRSTINIDANDTLYQVGEKMRKAMQDIGLAGNDYNVNRNIFKFLDKDEQFGTEGSFIMQGANVGTDSEVALSGDEALIKALGFNTVRKSEENVSQVKVVNDETGETVYNETVTSNKINGQIKGVNMEYAANTGLRSKYNNTTGALDFDYSPYYLENTLHFNVHNKNEATYVGETSENNIAAWIPEISSSSLGLTNIYINSSNNASQAITAIDAAIQQTLEVQNRLGSFTNRLQKTDGTLTALDENYTKSLSEINDVDYAEETSNYTKQKLFSDTNLQLMQYSRSMYTNALQLLRS